MKSEPKFKVGDKILYVGDGILPQEYGYIVAAYIETNEYGHSGQSVYRIKWDDDRITRVPCKHIDEQFVLYDSPAGIWARI